MREHVSTTTAQKEVAPGAWGGWRGRGAQAGGGFSSQCSTALALQVYRPGLGRWVTVAKLVPLGRELVLGIPYRHRQRLEGRVSLPLVVTRYAQEQGATAIVVRFDREGQAFRLPLADALRLGQRGLVDGQGEVFLSLALFGEVAWVDWPFATEAIRLGPGPEGLPRQLPLALGGVG